MATQNSTPDSIVETVQGAQVNITAVDRCGHRLTQARGIIRTLEQMALDAAQVGDLMPIGTRGLAETLWAASELLEQAQAFQEQAYTGRRVRVVG